MAAVATAGFVALSISPAALAAGTGAGALHCPTLNIGNPTHYNLPVGTTVTCTIDGATEVSGQTATTVFVKSSALGNTSVTSTVTGAGSGTTITFTYTAPANGCDTTIVAYGVVGQNANNSVINPGGNSAAGLRYVDASGNPISCTGPPPAASPPTISKDATGAFTTTWAWGIAKSVDKTKVEQVGGTATFNYTVNVTHDSGTNSSVQVSGNIDVTNPNNADVTMSSLTDQLSDGTNCTVSTGGSTTLAIGDNVFPYTCSLSAVPSGQLDNTATVNWGAQTLSDGSVLTVGSAPYTFSNISFTQTKVDDSVTVTDTIGGTLGTVSQSASSPTAFTYSNTVSVPQYGCQTVNNTATFTTNTSGTTGSDSKAVTVCGPVQTGALTMGFWQNKNGQGIITGGASTSGVCNSGTWLRQYAPFQDLSATATCAQVATYVTNIIKAATAAGPSMNAMLKAQMLSTALDVYFSDPSLGGNKIAAPGPIGGVSIDLTKVCANPTTCTSYEDTSSAFNGSPKTVSQLLSYAASQSNAGGTTWYGNVKATQGLAKDTFDATNNQVAFGG